MSEEIPVVEVLKVLAHPIRIRIADELHRHGSRRVGELSRELGVPQPIISQQLKILRGAKVVNFQRSSKAVSYSICDESAQALAELVSPRLAHDISRQNSPAPKPAKGQKRLFVDAESCPQDHLCLPAGYCPEGALTQEGFGLPAIDAAKCTLCGKCLPICPWGAFKIIGG